MTAEEEVKSVVRNLMKEFDEAANEPYSSLIEPQINQLCIQLDNNMRLHTLN